MTRSSRSRELRSPSHQAVSRPSSVGALATLLLVGLLAGSAPPARAQDNYEIQVYGSPTMPAGHTMVELHSNFTASGRRGADDGLVPSYHALHETLEITRGFNDWFEVGFYVFTSATPGAGWQWVGDHIRPRVRVPESWHWPVGVSISSEVGYQRRAYSVDTWTAELRPIVDWQRGPVYVAVNPTLEFALAGRNAGTAPEFAPNVAVGLDVTPRVNVAAEYYGGLGAVTHLEPFRAGEQQLFAAVNLDLSPDWEFNAGPGFGLTPATDRLLFKLILGRRFPRTHN